jgi:hypothetical protein
MDKAMAMPARQHPDFKRKKPETWPACHQRTAKPEKDVAELDNA